MNVFPNFYRKVVLPLADLSPCCKTVCRLQSEALDRQLDCRRRTGVVVHLFLCKRCRRYGKQIRLLRHLARARGDEILNAKPQELSSEARERILEKVWEARERAQTSSVLNFRQS